MQVGRGVGEQLEPGGSREPHGYAELGAGTWNVGEGGSPAVAQEKSLLGRGPAAGACLVSIRLVLLSLSRWLLCSAWARPMTPISFALCRWDPYFPALLATALFF